MAEEPNGTHDLQEFDKPVINKRSPDRTFKRQLPLLEEVRKHQDACPHALGLPNQNMIICQECNAVWMR